MRITAVHGYLLPRRPNPLHYRWRDGIPGSDPFVQPAILQIATDEGIDGLVEVQRGRMAMDVIERRLQPMLVGEDPLLRERLWERIWAIDHIEDLPLHLLGVTDLALWDILSKHSGVPVYKLLGGMRAALPAYASTVTFDTVEEYLEVADQCLELGYRAIKLHAWGDVRRDGLLAQAMREHVGDDIVLLYDGSAAFDLYDAIRLGRALYDLGFAWYEEPILDASISAYRALREKVEIPLLVSEHADGVHYNMADFVHFSAGDLVRTSWRLKGGLTGALRIALLASAFQLRAEVHGGGMANLQLGCAIPNTTYYEAMIRDNPVTPEPLVGRDGMAQATEELGVRSVLDFDAAIAQAIERV